MFGSSFGLSLPGTGDGGPAPGGGGKRPPSPGLTLGAPRPSSSSAQSRPRGGGLLGGGAPPAAPSALPFAGFGPAGGGGGRPPPDPAGGKAPPATSAGGPGPLGAPATVTGAAPAAGSFAERCQRAAAANHGGPAAPPPRDGGGRALVAAPGGRRDGSSRGRTSGGPAAAGGASCMSNDGRSFLSHSYGGGTHSILVEVAPFVDADDGRGEDAADRATGRKSGRVRIDAVLPRDVSESLSVDPVLGLVCCDGSPTRISEEDDGAGGRKKTASLPWVCVYTSASAFLLRISYPAPVPDDDDEEGRTIKGKVESLVEPFGRYLLSSPRGTEIVRIRPGPAGGPASCRPGSLAMLVREGRGRHAVVLHHGLGDGAGGRRGMTPGGSSGGDVTVPLRFAPEDLLRGGRGGDTLGAENEAYESSSLRSPVGTVDGGGGPPAEAVDFCFPGAGGSSPGGLVHGSTSVFVLAADGSVYGASPVLLDGLTLPRSALDAALSDLDGEVKESEELLRSSSVPAEERGEVEARLRQCRAARRYLGDAFGASPASGDAGAGSLLRGCSYHVTASVGRAPGGWTARLQGPLAVPPEEGGEAPDGGRTYLRIEPFGGPGPADGYVALSAPSPGGGTSGDDVRLDFGMVPGSGSSLLPRFDLESDADRSALDGLVCRSGRGDVESVSIASSSASGGGKADAASLVADPLDPGMVHVVRPGRGVATVTTDAVDRANESLRSRLECLEGGGSRGGDGGAERGGAARTKVWSCLEAGVGVAGACVSGDVHLGHVLVARLRDGSMEVADVTAAQCLHETSERMRARAAEAGSPGGGGGDGALEVLGRVRPLSTVLQPLVDKATDGLARMGKIVGGSTPPSDAGPESVAVFADTREGCSADVLSPLAEIAETLRGRTALLEEMRGHQSAELARLSSLLDELRGRRTRSAELASELERKAGVLASRSSAILTAARDVRPRVTDAEAEYFRELRRHEAALVRAEGGVDAAVADAARTRDGLVRLAGRGDGDAARRCLVDLPGGKAELCRDLLRGQGQVLRRIEAGLTRTRAGLDGLLAGSVDKENWRL